MQAWQHVELTGTNRSIDLTSCQGQTPKPARQRTGDGYAPRAAHTDQHSNHLPKHAKQLQNHTHAHSHTRASGRNFGRRHRLRNTQDRRSSSRAARHPAGLRAGHKAGSGGRKPANRSAWQRRPPCPPRPDPKAGLPGGPSLPKDDHKDIHRPDAETRRFDDLVAIARAPTPDPIPNSAVKSLCADGTASQGVGE